MRVLALFALVIVTWYVFAVMAFSQAMPEHDGHQWLQNKRTPYGQPCCSGGQSGDCQAVPFDSYSQDAKGGVTYGNYYFEPRAVFPTEDHHGRPFMCIFNGQARCAFIPSGV